MAHKKIENKIHVKNKKTGRKTVMAIEKVKEYFARYGMENRIKEFDVSSATVELAAKALSCEP